MFDTTLTASKHRRDAGRTLAVLPLALAAHALALGVVAVGQLWAVDAVPEPPALTVAFVDFRPPPPPPPPPPKGDQGTRTSRTPPRMTSPVQPSEAPSEAVKSTTPDSGGVPDGVPGGVADGGAGGVPGGVPRVPDQAPARVAEPVYRIDLVMTRPVIVSRNSPQYPETARRLRREGVVIVEATIDRHGNVVDARKLTDPGFGMAEAALAAIRGWRYEPATLDGRPVSVYLTVTVSFQLRSGA